MRPMRGIEQGQEVSPGRLLRDTRTIGQKVSAFFQNRTNVAVIISTMAMSLLVYPVITEILFIIATGMFLYTALKQQVLPMRLPKRARTKDFNDLLPGGNKPRMARGIAFFGNDRKNNEELWFNNDDLRTHVLIFGSTGSGKTEALVSISFNALLHGSGLIYVDGKGDNSLYAKIFSMARSMGREDDILIVNFMTGAKDIIGAQERRLSNTMNPFCTGSSSMLSQLVVSLMASSSSSSDGDMWKGRAIQFVEALMKVLVYMRDRGYILLDASSIRQYFDLNKLESIVADRIFVRDSREPVSLKDIPKVILEPLETYVFNLPGYNKDKKGKQVSQVLEQHGYITMQLTRVFSSLADTYGHIIRTNLAEVDFKDIVLNRRILVVLLPALEKSPDELANLGKVIIASLKAMMASGLGEDVEGDYRDVITRKPTNAPTPFLCILDEYGYYAVQGFAVVPAQARSLGFSAIFAGQDLPAFQKASKEEAASIGANTNIKICMKLEDPVETWDFFNKTAGEAYVTKVDSFHMGESSLTGSYLDTNSASYEKRARIDLLDLKEQAEGEAHIFFKSRIVRASMFFANPKPAKHLRINQFLKVEPPLDSLLQTMVQGEKYVNELFTDKEIIAPQDKIPEISKRLLSYEDNLIQGGIDILVETLQQTISKDMEEENNLSKKEDGTLTAFSKPDLNYLQKNYPQDVQDLLVEPIIDRALVKKFIKQVEYQDELSGNASILGKVDKIVEDVIKDVGIVTKYAKDKPEPMPIEEMLLNMDEFINLLKEQTGSNVTN
jgi:intracellular multiplication protein IcmO